MGTLMYINRLSDNFQKRTRVIIVSSLVLSIINYCIRIWGTTNETLLHSAPKLQNFAAKVAVGGMRKYDHVSLALKELNWLNIKQKKVLNTNCIMLKILRGMYHDWFKSFCTVHDVTGSFSRQQKDLYTPRTNTDTVARSLAILGLKLWNALPSLITSANSLPVFKSKLLSLLLE